MFIVKSNKAQYEYDIHSLVKAFYPEKDVRVLTPDSVVKDRKLLEEPVAIEILVEENKVVLTFFNSRENSPYTLHAKTVKDTDYKNAFKRFLYTSLCEETGMSLPWGNLTGIRPTKIAMSMLEQEKAERV